MSTFSTLMRRADTLRRLENDPVRFEWWSGYIRGLRRAHHGEQFGTAAEYELWMSAVVRLIHHAQRADADIKPD